MNRIIDKLNQQDRDKGMTRGRKLGRTAIAGVVMTAGVAAGFSSEGRQVIDTGAHLVKDIATAVVDGPPDTHQQVGSEPAVATQELPGAAAVTAHEQTAQSTENQVK